MILIHIFIREHKSLKNLNLPITGSFQCSYADRILALNKLQDTSEYYRNHHCSALIGSNGTGKSSILELLDNLTQESESTGIITFFNEDDESYHINLINIKEHEIKKINSDSKFIIHKENYKFLADHSINIIKIDSISNKNLKINAPYQRKNKNIHNLSVQENTKSSSSQKKYFNKLLNYFGNSLFTDTFTENVHFEFVFPGSSLNIIERHLEQPLTDDDENYDRLRYFTYIKKKNKILTENISEGSVFQSLLSLYAPSIIYTLAKSAKFYGDLIPNLYFELERFDDNRHISMSNKLRLLIRNIPGYEWARQAISDYERETRLHYIDTGEIEFELENILSSFNELSNIIYDRCYDGMLLNFSSMKIDNYDVVENLIHAINRLPSIISSTISWGWRGISSGELARTHMFSETYNYLNTSKPHSTNIFILDEVDLYLHPEWQRTFLHEFLTRINYIEASKDLKKAQIIVCTHSPIIISDFLAKDIISLRKDEYDQTVTIESSGFGSSIIDIYMNSMHLTSTFGEHARIKIVRLLENAQRGNLSDKDLVLIENISNTNIKNLLLNHDKNQ